MLVAGGLFDVILSMVGGGNQDGVTLRFVSAMHLGGLEKKTAQGKTHYLDWDIWSFGEYEQIICYIIRSF